MPQSSMKLVIQNFKNKVLFSEILLIATLLIFFKRFPVFYYREKVAIGTSDKLKSGIHRK